MKGSVALGCDRIGSVNGLYGAEAERLLSAALEMGVRVFDTAPVYGQGDSERLLGRVLKPRRAEVTIVTKVGQFFPWTARMMFPVKGMVRRAAGRSPRLRGAVAARRSGVLPRRFDPGFVAAQVGDSLRRLRTDRIDVLLLHSPGSSEPMAEGGLEALARLREAGSVDRIGVAAETAEDAIVALRCVACEVIEFPFTDAATFDRVASAAADRGARAIVRGVLSTCRPALEAADASGRQAIVARALGEVLSRPAAAAVLVGTTRIEHLREVVSGAPPVCEGADA